MKRIPTLLLSVAALTFSVTACTHGGHMNARGDLHHDQGQAASGDMHHGAEVEMKHENMWANIDHAVAVIYPTKGNSVSGTIYFDHVRQMSKVHSDNMPVHVHGTLTGLEPNSVHACHIHEFGDQSSADGSSAGSHYDPEMTKHHAQPTAKEPHHPGDLGNLTADASGKATLDLTVNTFTIAGMKDPIIGRSVVIHAKADDFTQPVGNAGGRIGVGIIGVAKAQP